MLHEESLSPFELRNLIESSLHQIEHLKRSQMELTEALVECPGDTDFAEAKEENELVLIKKFETVLRLQSILRQRDPSYKSKDAATEGLLAIDPFASSSLLVLDGDHSADDYSRSISASIDTGVAPLEGACTTDAATEHKCNDARTTSPIVTSLPMEDAEGGLYL